MAVKILSSEECKQHIQALSIWISAAMEHSAGESTLEDILVKLMSGIALCWMWTNEEDIPTMIGVTELIQYGRRKVCHIITTTGDWRAAHEVHDCLEQYAVDNGCESIMVWGRAGWARELTKFEFDSGRKYKQSYVVLEMPLGGNSND